MEGPVRASDPEVRSASTGELVRQLIDNLQRLVDRQVDLVKQELREDIGQVASAAKTLGIGLGLLLAAVICCFNFIFLGIDLLAPHWGWLAALICTLVFGASGALLARRGREQVQLEPLARTRESLVEDATWAKHRLTSNGSSPKFEAASPQPSRS
jgi:putative superfamily III holin-X